MNDPNNPNLYTYCANNPLINVDPSGNTLAPIDLVWDVAKTLFGWDKGKSNTTEKDYSDNYNQNQEEYTITQKLLDTNLGTTRERIGNSDDSNDLIKAIVIHWVGAPNQEASVTWDFFSKQSKGGSSAHYLVGLKGEVIQAVPDEKTAYTAGGPRYTNLANERFKDEKGNRRHNDWTINIETAITDSQGNYNTSTYTTMVRLVADKLNEYGLSTESGLLRHYDITGKDCPKRFEGENNAYWEQFKSDVELARTRK